MPACPDRAVSGAPRSSPPPAERPINILYLNLSTEVAGGELSLLGLLKGLDRLRHSTHVSVNGPGSFEEEARRLRDVTILRTHFPLALSSLARPSQARAMLTQTGRIVSYVRRNAIDILHVSHPVALLAASAVRALTGVHIVYHHRSYDTNKIGLLRLMAATSCARVIAISDSTRAQFLRSHLPLSRKVVRIYNGVDLDQFRSGGSREDARRMLGIPENRFVVGIVGRLAPHKGQRVLLEAAAILLSDRSADDARYFFVVAGSVFAGSTDPALYDYRDSLARFVSEHGLEPHVLFIPHRSDVPSILRAFDLLVAPSRTEPFGRVVVEGMAAGLPVLVARGSGGPEEIVRNGFDAVVIEEPSGPCLAEAIRSLVRDRALQQRLIASGSTRARDFSVQAYVSAVEQVYRQVEGTSF